MVYNVMIWPALAALGGILLVYGLLACEDYRLPDWVKYCLFIVAAISGVCAVFLYSNPELF